MVMWRGWEYRPVDSQLRVGDVGDQPEHWRKGVRSIEATIETLLAFNLTELSGLPLRLVRRAHPIEPSADVIATDPLRRVHLFELKKGSISGQAAAQLEQYLLRHVFGDADRFVSDATRLGVAQVDLPSLARDIAGVWANERTGIVGYKKVLSELGDGHPPLNPDGRRLSRYRWGRSNVEERLPLIHAALVVHGQKRGLAVPNLEDILDTAATWQQHFAADSIVGVRRLIATRRLVVWLVGASISDDAQERVRLWRRAGVDARVLRLTARTDGERWTMGVRRESASRRDEAERELFARVADPSQPTGSVKAVFYDERAPSEHSRHGGELLDEPIVRYL